MADYRRIREGFSKGLFGNAYRLEIAAAIYGRRDSTFSAKELSDATGIFYPRVQKQVKALEGLGMIEQVDSPEPGNRYRIRPSDYWRLCHLFLRELESLT